MLMFIDIKALLERFTYKPGWRFEIIEPIPGSSRFCIQYSFKAEDAFEPGRQTSIGSRKPLPPLHNEEQFWHVLLNIVEDAERHEAREWFKVDGQMPFNPHKAVR